MLGARAADPLDLRQEVHILSANGLSHYVRDCGPVDAPVALLLHGFPDDSSLWVGVLAPLVAAGFRIIAPDLRGFGESDMAARVADYEIYNGAIPDMIALMNALSIEKAHIAGHDFGAPVAWGLAAQHPDRFKTLTAISVGHVRSFLRAGAEQKRKSWYILMHQMRGISEYLYRQKDWRFLRRFWDGAGDLNETIVRLSRPGRLTAALNWYRANMPIRRMILPPRPGSFGEEIVRIPTLGVWSSNDRYLGEEQMVQSRDYVEASWRYKRLDDVGHWIPLDAPAALATMMIEHWRAAA